jgi:hypothetical protein
VSLFVPGATFGWILHDRPNGASRGVSRIGTFVLSNNRYTSPAMASLAEMTFLLLSLRRDLRSVRPDE